MNKKSPLHSVIVTLSTSGTSISCALRDMAECMTACRNKISKITTMKQKETCPTCWGRFSHFSAHLWISAISKDNPVPVHGCDYQLTCIDILCAEPILYTPAIEPTSDPPGTGPITHTISHGSNCNTCHILYIRAWHPSIQAMPSTLAQCHVEGAN